MDPLLFSMVTIIRLNILSVYKVWTNYTILKNYLKGPLYTSVSFHMLHIA